MTRRRSYALGFCIGLLVCAAEPTAGAAPSATSSDTPAQRVVLIEARGEPVAVARLRTTAHEVLSRLDLVIVVVTPEEAHKDHVDAWMRASVDLENARAPRLVLAEGVTRRALADRALPESASIETAVEAVTLVLYTLLESLLAGSVVETPGDEAPASDRAVPDQARARQRDASGAGVAMSKDAAKRRGPRRRAGARAVSPASAPQPSLTLDAGALARVAMLDDSHAIAGGGLMAELRAETIGAMILGSGHWSTELSAPDATAGVTVFSTRLLMTLSTQLLPPLSGYWGVGGGVDWLRVDVSRVPAGALESGSRSTLDGVLTGAVGARLRVSGPILVQAAGALDVDPWPRAFVAQENDQRRELLRLGYLRPSAFLVLAYSPSARGARGVATRGARGVAEPGGTH